MATQNRWLTALSIGLLCSFGAQLGVQAKETAKQTANVQVSSLEVKARIASMEQVNVTAEKPIDQNAPAPSAEVAGLLAELAALEGMEVETLQLGSESEEQED